MKALIIYESQGGHTRQAAEAIGAAVQKLGGQPVVKSVAEVRPADVQTASALFVGTWVHGFVLFGVHPAGADKWVPTLPSLRGKPVGVFCTYAFHPRGSLRTLGALLEERGAVVRGERAFQRSRPGAGAEEFVRGVIESAGLSMG